MLREDCDATLRREEEKTKSNKV